MSQKDGQTLTRRDKKETVSERVEMVLKNLAQQPTILVVVTPYGTNFKKNPELQDIARHASNKLGTTTVATACPIQTHVGEDKSSYTERLDAIKNNDMPVGFGSVTLGNQRKVIVCRVGSIISGGDSPIDQELKEVALPEFEATLPKSPYLQRVATTFKARRNESLVEPSAQVTDALIKATRLQLLAEQSQNTVLFFGNAQDILSENPEQPSMVQMLSHMGARVAVVMLAEKRESEQVTQNLAQMAASPNTQGRNIVAQKVLAI